MDAFFIQSVTHLFQICEVQEHSVQELGITFPFLIYNNFKLTNDTLHKDNEI